MHDYGNLSAPHNIIEEEEYDTNSQGGKDLRLKGDDPKKYPSVEYKVNKELPVVNAPPVKGDKIQSSEYSNSYNPGLLFSNPRNNESQSGEGLEQKPFFGTSIPHRGSYNQQSLNMSPSGE